MGIRGRDSGIPGYGIRGIESTQGIARDQGGLKLARGESRQPSGCLLPFFSWTFGLPLGCGLLVLALLLIEGSHDWMVLATWGIVRCSFIAEFSLKPTTSTKDARPASEARTDYNS